MSEKIYLPLVLLDNAVPFPGCSYNLETEQAMNEESMKEALLKDKKVMIVNAKDYRNGISANNIYTVGVYATILSAAQSLDGTLKIVFSAKNRGVLTSIERSENAIFCYSEEAEITNSASADEESSLIELIKDSFLKLRKVLPILPKTLRDVNSCKALGSLCDIIANAIVYDFGDKRHILEEFDVYKRGLNLLCLIEKEGERAAIKNEIIAKTRKIMDETQREFFLREELKVINKELGSKNDIDSEIDEYRKRAEALNMPDYVLKKLEKEYERLRRSAQGAAAEATVIRDYIDNVLSLPWGVYSKEKKNLKRAEQVLNKDHYGLDDVKERILEYLAVRQNVNDPSAPILCLSGPPGVGKTSVAKSIARALGREYVRIGLGGLSDENEIRGHRKTYIGAMPGRIIEALKQAKVSNPLILLDEIDKLGKDYKGDPAGAFLEILDSVQNVNFRDNYIELPYDLSRVFFVCTANTVETIPPPLYDRLEIINITSYTQNEKLHIAEDYLIPKQLKANGLTKAKLRIKRDAVETVIDGYTREAGVRALERDIGKICRRAVKKLLIDEAKAVTVTKDNIADFLGNAKFHPDTVNTDDQVGVCRGLAWTSAGGVTLSVEANVLNGSGGCKITGNVGKVMEESCDAALSYIKANAGSLGINTDFKNTDIHIHIPEGATPKDGPSAGITMATAMISALTNKPVRADVAMTGEISIRGRVMPIGGLKEKVLAAKRAGVKKIIIPYENAPDLEEIPEYGKNDIDFVLAQQMSDVLTGSIAVP